MPASGSRCPQFRTAAKGGKLGRSWAGRCGRTIRQNLLNTSRSARVGAPGGSAPVIAGRETTQAH